MSDNELFELTRADVIAANKKAIENRTLAALNGGGCLYTAGCAIGCALPRDVLDKFDERGWNAYNITDVLWGNVGVRVKTEDRNFFKNLQRAHDALALQHLTPNCVEETVNPAANANRMSVELYQRYLEALS